MGFLHDILTAKASRAESRVRVAAAEVQLESIAKARKFAGAAIDQRLRHRPRMRETDMMYGLPRRHSPPAP